MDDSSPKILQPITQPWSVHGRHPDISSHDDFPPLGTPPPPPTRPPPHDSIRTELPNTPICLPSPIKLDTPKHPSFSQDSLFAGLIYPSTSFQFRSLPVLLNYSLPPPLATIVLPPYKVPVEFETILLKLDIRAPMAAQRRLDPMEVCKYLDESQDLKLRFAIYKLKQDGLIETVEFVKLKCLQSILAMFCERNTENITRRISFLSNKQNKDAMDNWRLQVISILTEHANRAGRYIVAKVEAGSPVAPQATVKISHISRKENPLDRDTISFITILQLAALWDEDKYKWYINGFEKGEFTKMMEKRVKAFGRLSQ
ncbi:hypothetical protein TWF694_004363 [Orbilia ellipsospora]|uniref:Uncharacterized protein n=1 Tax=Orbilia ellipsospora TaxID=2528407 RepID=A0AAV9WZ21_9PEZI